MSNKPALLTEDEAKALARAARMPKHMHDTQECRLALVRFAALAAPAVDAPAPAAPVEAPELVARITAYLSGGGLFNPEMANHDAVRDLLIECRDALATKVDAPDL